MIIGIGVDIVDVRRIKHWLETAGLIERFFHPEEVKIILSRGGGAVQSMAARFAAKEAFGKAVGTGLLGITLKDIMVTNNHNGRPELRAFGTALEALERSGAKKTHLSLSHEKDYAIAMVVLE